MHNNKGFTLLEILIAITVMTIGLVAFLTGTQQAGKSMANSRDYTVADNLITEKLEEIRANYGKFSQFAYFKDLSTFKPKPPDYNDPLNTYSLEYNLRYPNHDYIGAGWEDLPNTSAVGYNSDDWHGKKYTRYWCTYSSFQHGGIEHKEFSYIANIKGNFQKLEQVIINLVINSCQALPDSQKGIVISSSYDKNNDNIIIKVRDEGVGFSQGDKKYILDPFYTTKRAKGGTGLGLSISYGILKEHQGSLEFESEPGEGTTVIVKLPVNNM